MFTRQVLLLPFLWLACSVTACRAPHVVLEVTDPEALATDADTLAFGVTLGTLQTIAVQGPSLQDGVTLTITAESEGQRLIWVEARRGSAVRARGAGRARLTRALGETSTVVLMAGCELEGQEGSTCVGEDLVDDTGICIRGTCRPSQCGDGYVDQATEECDDGELLGCGDEPLDACQARRSNANDGCHNCRLTRWTAEFVTGSGEGAGDPARTGLGAPQDIAVDDDGNAYVSVYATSQVLRYDSRAGVFTVAAGIGEATIFRGDGLPAPRASLTRPGSLALDGFGNLYIADGDRVRVVSIETGIIDTLVGGGDLPPDGAAGRSAVLGDVTGLAVDGRNRVYFSDDVLRQVFRYNPLTDRIRAVAGDGTACAVPTGQCGDQGPPLNAQLDAPKGLTLDAAGWVYVVDGGTRRVRRFHSDGNSDLDTVAGTGSACLAPPVDCGDGGSPTDAKLFGPVRIKAGAGALYVVDVWRSNVRVISTPDLEAPATWEINTLAGTGMAGTGANGPARESALRFPVGVAVGPAGDVWIADTGNNRVQRVPDAAAAEPSIEWLAGYGGAAQIGDGGNSTSAELSLPADFVVDGQGAIVVAVAHQSRLRHISVEMGPQGDRVITSILGNGVPCIGGNDGCGDGGPAQEAIAAAPTGIAWGPRGDLYFSDRVLRNVRRLVAAPPSPMEQWQVETVAGDGSRCTEAAPGCGDGLTSPRSAAQFSRPEALLWDAGALLVADADAHRIRRVVVSDLSNPATWTIETVVGTGVACTTTCDFEGLAAAAELNSPEAIATDGAGHLLIADAGSHRVRMVTMTGTPATWTIETVAGSGTPCAGDASTSAICASGRIDVTSDCGDGLTARAAQLTSPSGVLFDGAGGFFIADSGAHQIRQVNGVAAASTISRVAGTGTCGFRGDGGAPTDARLAWPTHLARDATGRLLVSEQDLGGIRRIDLSAGRIDTLAGRVHAVGHGPTTFAYVPTPAAVARLGDRWATLDTFTGSVAILDLAQRWLSPLRGYRHGDFTLGPQLAGFANPLVSPRGMVADGDQLYVSDAGTGIIHRLWLAGGDWYTEALAGGFGYAEGVLADARFRSPRGMAIDASAGVLYVADANNFVVRRVDLAQDSTSVAAGKPEQAGFEGGGHRPLDELRLNGPSAVALGPGGDLFIADTDNHRVVRVDADAAVTVIGDGTPGSGGRGQPARSFRITSPRGLAFDPYGNLIVVATDEVKLITPGADGRVGDDDKVEVLLSRSDSTFPAPLMRCLSNVAVVAEDRLWLLEDCIGVIIELRRQ